MLTDHTSNEIYVKHAITCNITTAAEANALMANARTRQGMEGNDYASMKLLGQNPQTSSSDTNSFDDEHNRKPPPPIAGSQQPQPQQPQPQQSPTQGEPYPPPPPPEHSGSIEWLDQDQPPPQYEPGDPQQQQQEVGVNPGSGEGINDVPSHHPNPPTRPVSEHYECCPELLRGHSRPVPAIRYIVPPHQCQQCGGQVPHKHPMQVQMPGAAGPQQVQTLGRFRQDSGSGTGEPGTPGKPRRHISFASTLPSAKFGP